MPLCLLLEGHLGIVEENSANDTNFPLPTLSQLRRHRTQRPLLDVRPCVRARLRIRARAGTRRQGGKF